jgi:hypothetical protein
MPTTGSGGEVVRPSRPVMKVRTTSGEVKVLGEGERVSLGQRPKVDVRLALDTTRSMSDKIKGLITCFEGFVAELGGLKLDWNFSVVPFGDLTIEGDRIVGDLPVVNTVQQAQAMIRGVPRFNGGGNYGESSLEALQITMDKSYRQGSVKLIILATDEPPLTTAQFNSHTITAMLRRREFICFATTEPDQGYEAWADHTGGKWYPIGSNMNTVDLMKFLRGMLRDVAHTAKAVHVVGGGSVHRYIERKARGEIGR